MPFVRFLKDYQGSTTNNIFYQAGTVIDLPGRMSYALRSEGVVEKVAPTEPTTAADPYPAAVVDVPHEYAPKMGQGTKSARKSTRKTAKKAKKAE